MVPNDCTVESHTHTTIVTNCNIISQMNVNNCNITSQVSTTLANTQQILLQHTQLTLLTLQAATQ